MEGLKEGSESEMGESRKPTRRPDRPPVRRPSGDRRPGDSSRRPASRPGQPGAGRPIPRTGVRPVQAGAGRSLPHTGVRQTPPMRRPAQQPRSRPKQAPPPKPVRRRPPLSAAERRRRRRRRMFFFYIFLFLAVIGTAVTLSLTVLFRVERIEVRGESRYSAEQIMQASGLETGGNLFLTDTGAAAAAIEKALPYIGEAKVSRVLPSELSISVQEEPAASAILWEGQYVVLGASGKVLELASAAPENCPVIKGVVMQQAEPGSAAAFADEEASTVLQRLESALSAVGVSPVSEIDLTDLYRVSVLYDGRISLQLGAPTNYEEKLRFFTALLEQGRISETDSGTFDLSLAAETNHGYFEEGLPSSAPASSATASSDTVSPGPAASGGDSSAAEPAAG